MLSFLPLLAAVVGALIGASVTRYLNRRKERFQATLDLFNHYHSDEMQKSRRDAWKYLKGAYAQDPRSFSELFSDRAEGAHVGQYYAVSNILYFWYMVWMLNEENEIIQPLAKKMFSYQYNQWRGPFEPLYRLTLDNETDKPEWLPAMNDKEMKWLSGASS